jgi:hypothetical protein
VLAALAARARLADPAVAAFLRSARMVSSDYDRARILLAILKTQPVTGPNRTLFLEVADSISSAHEQNQVLAALVRAERR